MTDWALGLSTGCFYQTSIFDVLKEIRNGGFSLIEICSHRDHLDYRDRPLVRKVSELIEDFGMEPFSFHAPFAENIDITSLDASVRQHSLEEVLRAAEAAQILKLKHLAIHPGPEKEGPPPRKNASEEWTTPSRL